MGIRGLQSFIENNFSNALEPVNIGHCARMYQTRMKKQPELLIDAKSCYRHWYERMNKECLQLGLFKDFETYLLNMMNNYSTYDIKCIFFFDGAPSDERESLWIKRKNESGKEVIKGFRFHGAVIDMPALRWCSLDIVLEYILRKGKCVLMRTVRSADEEILEYVASNGCFGVLSQDTDYLIMEGIENYFSAKNLKNDGLTTIAYRRKTFAANIGIDEEHLPLFATLSGNDVLSDDDLRTFHLSLLRQDPAFNNHWQVKFLPKRFIFKNVACWILNNVQHLADKENLAKTVATLICLPHLEQKLQESITSYLPTVYCDEKYKDQSKEWTNIVNVAERRHRYEGAARELYCVLTRLKFYASPCPEMYSVQYPCSGELTRKLRRRLWGILLKNRPKHLGETIVQEFVFYGHDIVPENVDPCFPDCHPGLLVLWSDPSFPEEGKLKLVCWAVSEKLNVNKVKLLPRCLRIAFLTIFYLIHEVESGLSKKDMEALLATAILLPTMSSEDVSKLPDGVSSTLETHIKSVFLETWGCISAVDDACGNSIDPKKDVLFFDGKVFHYYYELSHSDNLKYEMDSSLQFQIIMEFLYN